MSRDIQNRLAIVASELNNIRAVSDRDAALGTAAVGGLTSALATKALGARLSGAALLGLGGAASGAVGGYLANKIGKRFGKKEGGRTIDDPTVAEMARGNARLGRNILGGVGALTGGTIGALATKGAGRRLALGAGGALAGGLAGAGTGYLSGGIAGGTRGLFGKGAEYVRNKVSAMDVTAAGELTKSNALKRNLAKARGFVKKNPLLSAGIGAGALGLGALGLSRRNRVNAMDITAVANEPGAFNKTTKVVSKDYGKKSILNWIKRNPKKSAGLLAAGLAAGGYGVYRNRKNKVNAMEYFENITAAEYLEDITGGNLGFSVSASDYSDLMNISAMEYIIAEDDVASELTDLSADVAADVTDAETPEEFADAVQNNQELADAHADAAEINADTAAREGTMENAALAEYHANLADEHEDLANDVISALYYE